MLNTLKLAQNLAAAGMARDQAEQVAHAINDAIEDTAATKADVDALGTELRAEIALVRAEIDHLRTELRADIDQLRTELRAEVDQLRTEFRSEMAALEERMTRRLWRAMVTVVVANASVLAAFVAVLALIPR